VVLDSFTLLESGASAEALLAAGDLLDAGVLITDESLVVRGWNRWFAAASGLSASEVVGRSLIDVFPAIAESGGENAFRRALIGETTIRAHRFHRYLLPLPTNPAFPEFDFMQQSARIAPLTKDGRITGVIALVEDVTERVAREAELQMAIESAEAANRAKSDFIAAMSHELRTPLGAIIGYADILEAEISGPLTAMQKQHMNRVKVGAYHLMGIIEEILTFSRADAGREELHVERVRPSSAIDEASVLVEPQAAAKGLGLRLTMSDLPSYVETDSTKLRQILVNLLGNAVKFTEIGEVTLHAYGRDESIFFEISDTGPGIAAEHLENIFEPFTQVDHSLTRQKGGTGLGLAVSRRLAALMGGDLWVESAPGSGSTFTLRIPLAIAALEA
jgi:signal transduction histidine kinase